MSSENPMQQWGQHFFYTVIPLFYGVISSWLALQAGIRQDFFLRSSGIFLMIFGFVLGTQALGGILISKAPFPTTGIFRVFRHPLAISYLFICGGIVLLGDSGIGTMFYLLFVIPVTVVRVKLYEVSRCENQEYQEYLKSVLFPF